MSFFKNPIIRNLIIAVVASILLLFAVLKWLDIYTRHNQAVVVPNLKGLNMENAGAALKHSKLEYNIIDSVYSKEVPPGAVVDIIPQAGSKVKEGRIVFITINATNPQTVQVPEVEDLSFRQAYALLKSRGFSTIETEYVPGDYKDLAIAVELNGQTLHPDENVPVSAALKLIVSSGEAEIDSLSLDMLPVEHLDSEDEKWF